MFVGEINYKHFADSRTGVPGGFITSITSKKSSNQKPLRIIDRFVFNNLVVDKDSQQNSSSWQVFSFLRVF